MPRKTAKTETPCPEFVQTREFIARYAKLPTEADYDLVTLWAMGTWTFSPASPARPVAYPYLYLTGAMGSGKTNLGINTLKWVCRQHRGVIDITGAALFRMLGDYDKESGQIIPHYPTLALDEIDAKYASGGSNDEQLRGVANAGYQAGATVPRAAGKQSIEFPVYCPKLFIGIDNGRLPGTLLNRCIRIDIEKGTPEQLDQLEEGPYSFDVQEEAADLQQMLAEWAKDNAMILRDYRPKRPDSLSGRHWEVARAMIQLGKAAGIEKRITDAVVEIMGRSPERPDAKVALYQAILELFDAAGGDRGDRLTTVQILAHLRQRGIGLPGDSGSGLWSALRSEGIGPRMIRFTPEHPGYDTNKVATQRGYMRFQFDAAFAEYLASVDDEDDD